MKRIASFLGVFLLILLVPSCSRPKAPKPLSAFDNWPRDYTGPNGGRLTVYQPQFEKWDDYKTIVARLAAGLIGSTAWAIRKGYRTGRI